MIRRGDESGTATAELAVLLPALAVLFGVGLRGLAVGAAQVSCVDAARAAARLAARGDAPASVETSARRLAPRGAAVRWSRGPTGVRVVVSARPSLLPGISLTVEGRAEADLEPGA